MTLGPFRLAALVLLLLLPSVLAQDIPNGGPPTILATWQDGALHVTLGAHGGGFRGGLLIQHDEDGVPTIDRFDRVDLAPVESRTFSFTHLRPGVSFSARVLAEGVVPAPWGSSSLFEPGQSIGEIEHATVDAPNATALVVTHVADAASPYQQPSTSERAFFTRDGILVSVSVAGGELRARASRDGGRSWGGPVSIASDANDQLSWDAAEASDGSIRIVTSPDAGPSSPSPALPFPGQAAPIGPWGFDTFDALHGTLALSHVDSDAPTSGAQARTQVRVRADGSAVVAAVNGSGFGVWRLESSGSTHLADVTLDRLQEITMAARGDDVAVFGRVAPGAGLVLATSRDGGATFTAPQPVAVVNDLSTGDGVEWLSASRPLYDATGTLHATFIVGVNFGQNTAYYRAPRDGVATAIRLNRPTDDAEAGRPPPPPPPNGGLPGYGDTFAPLALSGDGRVTLVYGGSESWLMESHDGGASFSRLLLEFHAAAGGAWEQAFPRAIALAPDARPLVFGPASVDGSTVSVAAIAFDPLLTDADAAAATPAPTIATLDSTVHTETFDFYFLASDITVPRGSSTDARLVVRDTSTDMMGTEPPTFRNVPEGLTLRVDETNWSALGVGESKEYAVHVTAAPDATNGTYVVEVHGRRAVDRPDMVTNLTVTIGPRPPQLLGASPPLAIAGGFALLGTLALLARSDGVRRWLALLGLPLYSRLARGDTLANEVRSGVYEHVAQNPGARLSDITRATGLTTSPVVFHLRVLEKNGFVRSTTTWTRRRYYATGHGAPPPEPVGVGSTIAGLLEREPGLAPAEVASRLQVSRQLARYHLLQLERQGAVRRAEDGEGYLTVVRR